MYTPSRRSFRPVLPQGLEARLAMRSVTEGRRAVVPLPGDDPASARRARQAVRYQLASWGVPEELAEDLVLVVSELVANGVTHAAACPQVLDKRLWIVLGRHPGAVLVAVVDNGVYDPRCLQPQRPDDMASGGRGLYIVAELSDRWGHFAHPQGTCVWAARDWPALPPVPITSGAL
jgi:anti-sigma regulatory factor (Ser/Thr protein kinase)